MKLLLLPGMDGTGELFADFVAALPENMEKLAVSYPPDQPMGYEQLLSVVMAAAPVDKYVIVAESFSTPLAMMLAAQSPPGLCGVVLCAGFATCPVRGWRRWVASWLGEWAFRIALPEVVMEWVLLGARPTDALMDSVRRAVAWVEPEVMELRVREVLRVDVRPDLAKVKVPLLAMLPGKDRLVSDACVREMLEVRPMESVAVDAPHLLLQREPQLCANVVMGFVNKIAQSQ